VVEVRVGQVWQHKRHDFITHRVGEIRDGYAIERCDGRPTFALTIDVLRRRYTLVQDEHGNRVGTCSASRGRA